MTPEGLVKKEIKSILDSKRPHLYYNMPVPGGYGKSTLDFLGCYYGRFFAIEAKRPGKRPTERQDGIIEDILAARGRVFRIHGGDGLRELLAWIDTIDTEEAS